MDENKGIKVEANMGFKEGATRVDVQLGAKLGAKIGSKPVTKPDAKPGA